MKILFIHKHYPAQFGAFGEYLVNQGWDVQFIATHENPHPVPSYPIRGYKIARDATPGVHSYIRDIELSSLHGQAVAGIMLHMKVNGYTPDVVMHHSGFGPGMFVKDVWPETKVVAYLEWYYRAEEHLDKVEDTVVARADISCRARMKNATFLVDVASADLLICPTNYQADMFPKSIRKNIQIEPDGFDTVLHSPDHPNRTINGVDYTQYDELVTYATRGMEPIRGFPEFMRAVALLQKRRPNMHVAIAAGESVHYGQALPEGESWKTRMLAELDLDLSRIHFTGTVVRDAYVSLMRAGKVHVYLTQPFVLSWSFVEAMSSGCLLVASDIASVREFVDDGVSGLLVDHQNVEALADRIEHGLVNQEKLQPLRETARKYVLATQDSAKIYADKMTMLENLVKGVRRDPITAPALTGAKKTSTPEYFFVTGLPRSGTTMLSLGLGKHPNLFVPSEHSLFDLRQRIADLMTEYNKNIQELDTRTAAIGITPFRQNSLNSLWHNATISLFNEGEREPHYRGIHDNNLAKFPDLYTSAFPEAKIIWITRDPLDQIRSAVDYNVRINPELFAQENPDLEKFKRDRAIASIGHLKTAIRHKSENKNIMFLRYEDFVPNKTKHLKKCFQFLGAATGKGLCSKISDSLSFTTMKKETANPLFFGSGETQQGGAAYSDKFKKKFYKEHRKTLTVFGYDETM